MIRNAEGSIAVTAAVSLLTILVVIGFTIDMSRAMTFKRMAQDAADSAVLACLSETTEDGSREDAAQDHFTANLSPNMQTAVEQADFILTTMDDGVLRCEATYSLGVPTAFMGLLGKEALGVDGKAAAIIQTHDSFDIHFWIDTSASMLIAADETGRDALRQMSVKDPQHKRCAFACHLPTQLEDANKDGKADYRTSLERARVNKIPLRIDLARKNVEQLILRLEARVKEANDRLPPGVPEHSTSILRASLHSMDSRFQTWVKTTANLKEFKRQLGNIQPFRGNSGQSSSFLSATIGWGENSLPTRSGSGSQADPRQIVVIVTDGFQFSWNSIPHGPIDYSVCERIKDRGITLAVVELRYVPLEGDGAYNTWVKPVIHKVGPALQQCASQNLYFSADHPDEMERVFNLLEIGIIQTARLVE